MKGRIISIIMTGLFLGFSCQSLWAADLVLNFSGGAAGDAVKKYYVALLSKIAKKSVIAPWNH